jgi:hypothetical protein
MTIREFIDMFKAKAHKGWEKLTPIFYEYGDGVETACAVTAVCGVLLEEKNGPVDVGTVAKALANVFEQSCVLSEDFVNGVVKGFDDEDDDDNDIYEDDVERDRMYSIHDLPDIDQDKDISTCDIVATHSDGTLVNTWEVVGTIIGLELAKEVEERYKEKEIHCNLVLEQVD